MVKSVDNSVLEKVEDLVSTIKGGKEYHEYIELAEKVKKNDKINKMIQEIKALQKEIVKQEMNGENVENLEKKVKNYLDQLENIPLYTDFVEKQQELNEIYQLIKKRLDDYFYEKFN